jgi:hypothetical protein
VRAYSPTFGSPRSFVASNRAACSSATRSPSAIVAAAALVTSLTALAGVGPFVLALVALAAACARPRSREEGAFAALAVAFGAGLLLEAAVYAANGSSHFQERYLIAFVPLVPIAFVLSRQRSPRAIAVLGLTGFVAAAAVPLSGYAAGAGSDSQFLSAVRRAADVAGAADGALAVSLLAGALSLVAAASALRQSHAPVGLILAAAVAAAVSAGAANLDRQTSQGVREAYLPPDLQWVDHAGVRDVALLQTPRADAGRALDQLFWNRSIRHVLLLPGARGVDALGAAHVELTDTGALVQNGRPVRQPLLVQTAASSILMEGAARVASGAGFELWKPDGVTRLALLALGRSEDGWLARAGTITVWPGAAPRLLRLTLSVPPRLAREEIVLDSGAFTRRLRLPPGTRRRVLVNVPAGGPLQLAFRTGPVVGIRAESLALERRRA